MGIFEAVLGHTPSLLMVSGAILYYVPATWIELPIEPNTLGIALFGLGVVLSYAGWYDRFDIESDTSADYKSDTESDISSEYKFDIKSDTSADDATSQTPVRTDGNLVAVRKYGPAILISIGATLSWGQIRNPNRLNLLDRPPLELPWGELPVLGFVLILAGLALLALTHPASPLFIGE